VPEAILEGVVPGLADPNADREIICGEKGSDFRQDLRRQFKQGRDAFVVHWRQ